MRSIYAAETIGLTKKENEELRIFERKVLKSILDLIKIDQGLIFLFLALMVLAL